MLVYKMAKLILALAQLYYASHLAILAYKAIVSSSHQQA
jgi:hypothetical protein